MDFNFDGKGTSGRQINLGGLGSASSSNRTPAELAKQARLERAKREESRIQNNAATTLQALFRSAASSRKSRSQWSTRFDQAIDRFTSTYTNHQLPLDQQSLREWVSITRLLVFSLRKATPSPHQIKSNQKRLQTWSNLALATHSHDSQSQTLLLLPFSIPTLASSWSTLLTLTSDLILSQLSSKPYLLPQDSAISYLNVLSSLIDPDGPASKIVLDKGKGEGELDGANWAMFLGDKLVRNGLHLALRRHLLNFPIDRKSSSTLEPTISISLSIFKLFPPSSLPGSASNSAIIVDSEDSSNSSVPTRSYALSTFISQILTIPSLSSRIPLSSIPTLTKFPFFETLEHLKSLGNYISLTTGDSVLENNPLKNPYLLGNLLTLGSKRVPHFSNGKQVKLWLEAITIAQDSIDETVFKSPPSVELEGKGKGKGKEKQEVRYETLNQDEDSDMTCLNSSQSKVRVSKSSNQEGSNDYTLPLDAATYKALTILFSESHLNSILTASNKFPTVTRLPLSFFLNSIFSNWDSEVKEKVLSYIFMYSLTSSSSTTLNGHAVQTNTVSSLIKELYKGYIRSSKLSIKILSSNAGNGAKEALSTLVDEKYQQDWPSLILLLELYSRALLTIGDDEFYPASSNESHSISNANATGTNHSMSRNPLSLDEIKNLSSILRNLAFSLYWNEGTGILTNFTYQNNPGLNGNSSILSNQQNEKNIPRIPGMKTSLLNLRNLVTKVLQQLYSRDCRKPFCEKDHWLMVSQLDLGAFIQTVVLEEQELSSQAEEDEEEEEGAPDQDLDVEMNSNRGSAISRSGIRGAGSNRNLPNTNGNSRIGNGNRMDLDDDEDNPPLPISDRIRNHRGKAHGLSAKNLAFLSPRLGVLNNIPFVIPFEVRIEIFRQFIRNDAQKLGIQRHNFSRHQRHRVVIRRDHVAQDGFAKLNQLGPSLKGTIEIVFIDQFGQEEAGIDGGGVFKEFLTSLTKEAFDTNRGLWKATDLQELYPNPHSYSTMSESLEWYTFLGRVLGKALYDGILVDIKFAGFFLEKWLGKGNYLDDLASLDNLDKELYKGLIYLKNYQGDVESDFSLNFTVTDDEFGEKRTTELIPGGSSIAVTRENRLNYIYRVSHYRLSTQISKQCQAFFAGLSELIDPRWLRMLNREELRFLVSGTEEPIDIDDLRANTVYGGYHEKDASVEYFWEALKTFNQERRKSFLKFVTSCPSPPLLGFSQLNPKFAIRLAGEDDTRLPTASTCVNLLKLPRYKSLEQCRDKLIYAIDSGAGFDLS